MTLETEQALDRRRMRRRVSLWRAIALATIALALGIAAFKGEELAGLGPQQIARVSIEGTITDDRQMLEVLKKAKEAKNVAGVLVFVNSPGGTTTGGEALFEALRDLAKEKPVVAQFGTIAASAGYIVGLGTDYIVSRGNTITGSIGVLAQWPEVSDLLGKLGVKMNEVKSGALKAEPNPFKPADPAALRVMQDSIDDGFRWFLSLVEGRRKVVAANIPGLLEGRIYSGREALQNKLVDEIGGETEAVRWLVDKRGVAKDLKVVDWRPARESEWSFGGATARLAGAGLAAAVGGLTNPENFRSVALDGLVSVWQPAEK